MTQFKVRKDLIYSACTRYIHSCMKKRGKFFRSQVKYYMEKKIGFIDRVFYKKKQMTLLEAAIFANKFGDNDGFWNHKPWKEYYQKSINECKYLIKACEIDCEDFIMLSTEDAAFVNEWCKK